MQCVDARGRDRGNERPDAAGGMEHGPDSVPAGDFHEALQAGRDEALEVLDADERTRLGAEVVPDEDQVDEVTRFLENAGVYGDVVVDDAGEHGLHEKWVVVHEAGESLHAHQVHRVVPEGRPGAPDDGVTSGRVSDPIAYKRDVLPFALGPGIVAQVFHGRRFAQRMGGRLAVAAAAAFDAEGIHPPQALPDRRGVYPAEIVPDAQPERLLVDAELGAGLGDELPGGSEPARDRQAGPALEGSQEAFLLAPL